MTVARRAGAAATGAVVLVLGGAGSASAHVQVQPSVVAPNDPVEFTVIVPSERAAHTTKVDLKLPAGVLPFAYGDAPGWKRRLVTARNGAIDRVVWTGRLAEDGYARFTFLAGTPERPGTLTWKALQTYDDGTVARWIGTPDSESPAPVVRVEADAPRQNAGGEGAAVQQGGTPGAAPASTGGRGPDGDAPVPVAAAGDGTDWLARGLAAAGLLVASAGAWAAVRRAGRA